MAIPYKVKELRIGKIKIYSELFKYLTVSNQAFINYFGSLKGVNKVIAKKEAGLLTIYYDPASFDLANFYSIFENGDRELILSLLSSNGFEKTYYEEERYDINTCRRERRYNLSKKMVFLKYNLFYTIYGKRVVVRRSFIGYSFWSCTTGILQRF
jgi:hypothetical protein